jgi:hypothetical protein
MTCSAVMKVEYVNGNGVANEELDGNDVKGRER